MKNITSTYLAPVLLALIIISAPLVFARQAAAEQSGHRGRLAPPATLACDRNLLTSYNGEVSHYKRGLKATGITIHTDSGTIESLTLKHTSLDSLQQHFLLRGQAFTSDDWVSIEVESGVLLDGMRAIAWVCMDKQVAPVIDWQPL